MKKLKVITILGTRPEIIRLSRVISQLDKFCEHTLVHTGQNYDYELNEVFFNDLGVKKPNYFLNSAKESDSVSCAIGNMIAAVDKVLEEVKPEAILVLGDTNSCLSAIAAKRRKIPIFHMEAGNRCFDIRVPEEINRRLIDHLADVNLTYSAIAREYLLREGLPSDLIIKTGSPMFEVLDFYRSKIDLSDILKLHSLEKDAFFLISAHREENIEPHESFSKLVGILNMIAEDYSLPVIVSTHPRTRKRINESNLKFHKSINFLKPLGFYDYIKLQLSARVVLSDSGTINEESSILNFPALNLRETCERPEGMEAAAVMMVGLEIERVRQGIFILANQSRNSNISIVPDYMIPDVSEKIIRIIHSYTDYVNRIVWKKY